MLNITIIPLITFLFMFFIPILISVFKGWKISLVFMGVFFVFNVAFTIVLSILYKELLWPMFDKLFINNKIQAGTSTEVVAEYAKTSVISIALLILIPFSLIISLVTYILLNTVSPIYHFLHNDKTVAKGDNEREIVKTMSLKKHYLLGGAVGVAQGLYLGSIVMSSTATLVTSTKNNNFFNKTTRAFATAFTFGQANYDADFQYIYEWLPTGTVSYFQPMYNVMNFFGTNAEYDTIDSTLKSSVIYAELIKNKNNSNISLFLAKNIAAKGTPTNILLLNNPGSAGAIEDIIDSLETTWGRGLNTNIHPDAVSYLVSSLQNNFVDFKNSTYYVEWNSAVTLVKEATRQLKERRDLLATNKSILATSIKNIKDANDAITKLNDDIRKANDKIDETNDTLQEKLRIYEAKYSDFQVAEGNKNAAQYQVDSIDLDIRALENEKAQAETDDEKAEIQVRINNKKAELVAAKKDLDNAAKLLATADAAYKKADKERQAAIKAKDDADNKLVSLQGDLTRQEVKRDNAEAEKINAESTIAILEGNGSGSINEMEGILDELKREEARLLEIKNAKLTEYNVIKNKLLTLFKNVIK